MTYVLWIAPNLNHYKVRLFNQLVSDDFELTVLVGRELSKQGHRQVNDVIHFKTVSVPVGKSNFQYYPAVYKRLTLLIGSQKPQFVLMPIEKKFSIMIVYLVFLRLRHRFQLVSYNHPLIKSSNSDVSWINRLITKTFYRLYDRVIFYTSQSRDWAVENKLLPDNRAFFANNTLDTKSIWENYSFAINKAPDKTILFIGRLIPSKRLDLLFKYFSEIQKVLPTSRLKIIGDGPEQHLVEKAVAKNSHIEWLGAIVDEKQIASYMNDAHVVFVPGHSGLSIVHAFCYGKPYVTLNDYRNHPPEIDYLTNMENGLLLTGDRQEDISKILRLLQNQDMYESMCRDAFDTAKKLSIDNWSQQMHKVFTLK